jgi:hypothetical protein
MSTNAIKTQIAKVISTATGVLARDLEQWFETPKNSMLGDPI